MQRHSPQSIGDVLRNLLEETSLQTRMDELKAVGMWKNVIGESLAAQTSVPTVRNGVMRVGVPNAALRNELYMHRGQLLETINNTIGKNIITEIKFTS